MVRKGIVRVLGINPVIIKAALKGTSDLAFFSFSRIWKVPRLVLELSSGRITPLNASFLIPDDKVACKVLLMGFPVFRHLGVDSCTLLERKWSTLEGIDYVSVNNIFSSGSCGSLGHLMVDHIQRALTNAKNNSNGGTEKKSVLDFRCSRGNYLAHKYDTDPLPNPHLLDMDDISESEVAWEGINSILTNETDNGFPTEYGQELQDLVLKHIAEFRISFSYTLLRWNCSSSTWTLMSARYVSSFITTRLINGLSCGNLSLTPNGMAAFIQIHHQCGLPLRSSFRNLVRRVGVSLSIYGLWIVSKNDSQRIVSKNDSQATGRGI